MTMLDFLAVYSAYHHLKIPKAEAAGVKPPHVIVTGCVDTIQITAGKIKVFPKNIIIFQFSYYFFIYG